MTLSKLVSLIHQAPKSVQFSDVIAMIDAAYEYTPAEFRNGDVVNAAGTNHGSCKIFSFGKLHELTEQETLHCFGDFYRKDVLENPDGADHSNIRQFMIHGWAGIEFKGAALKQR